MTFPLPNALPCLCCHAYIWTPCPICLVYPLILWDPSPFMPSPSTSYYSNLVCCNLSLFLNSNSCFRPNLILNVLSPRFIPLYNKGWVLKLATKFWWNLSLIFCISIIVRFALKFSLRSFFAIHWVVFLTKVKESVTCLAFLSSLSFLFYFLISLATFLSTTFWGKTFAYSLKVVISDLL